MDPEKTYSRFDVKLIDLVQPRDGHDLLRKLDVILYFLQLGDDQRYSCRDRWCSTDIGAHMSGTGRGATSPPLTIGCIADIEMAVRMAILGHGRPFVGLWRKDHQIHVDAVHRVHSPHVRHHQWDRWEASSRTGPWRPALEGFLTGGHPIAVSLNCYHPEDRDLGRLELEARPTDGPRPRRHLWSLASRRFSYKGALVTQDAGEPIAQMLTRASDYIQGLKKPGAAFVATAWGNPFEFAVFREGGDPSSAVTERQHWTQIAGPFRGVNDAVRDAILRNAQ